MRPTGWGWQFCTRKTTGKPLPINRRARLGFRLVGWVRSDDRKPWTRKMQALTDSAYRLYDHALHHAASNESDGEVRRSDLPTIVVGIRTRNPMVLIAELTSGGLWHTPGQSCDHPTCPATVAPAPEGSWIIHDYWDHNRSHAELEALRDADRVRKSGRKVPGLPAGFQPESGESSSRKKGGLPAGARPSAPTRAPASRPVPSPRSPNGDLYTGRSDVEQLCQEMQRLVSERAKAPLITATWAHDARLILDQDRHPLEEALGLMRWAAADPFWRKNVLGIPKFRLQYDRLRMDRGDKPGKVEAPTGKYAKRMAEALVVEL
jgi:hypothetical protein